MLLLVGDHVQPDTGTSLVLRAEKRSHQSMQFLFSWLGYAGLWAACASLAVFFPPALVLCQEFSLSFMVSFGR